MARGPFLAGTTAGPIAVPARSLLMLTILAAAAVPYANAAPLVQASFESGEDVSDWNGGTVETLCQKSAYVTSGQEIASSISVTTPASNAILQFDYFVGEGCEFETSTVFDIGIVFREDDGSTTTVTTCTPSSPSSCATGISYPGPAYPSDFSAGEWVRVTLHLPGNIKGKLVFRASTASPPTQWAIDNVYLGGDCPGGCLNSGYCTNTGTCACDDGFAQDTTLGCRPQSAPPATLREQFDDDISWDINGGEISRRSPCGRSGSGNALVFVGKSAFRSALTPFLDARGAGRLNAIVQIGGSDCEQPDSTSESVVIGYSLDGGSTVVPMRILDEDRFSTGGYVSVAVPDEAKTQYTRFVFLQVAASGVSNDFWSIDDVSLQAAAALPSISTDFADVDVDESLFVSVTGGTVSDTCQRTALEFSESLGRHQLITAPVMTGSGTMVQFDLAFGCFRPSNSYDIIVEHSTNGEYFTLVTAASCSFEDSSCTTWPQFESTISSQFFSGGWRRVTLLPSYTDEVTRQFRVSVKGRDATTDKDTPWALSHMYIGDACPGACGNLGKCVEGICVCDADATQTDDGSCTQRSTASELRERFEEDPSPTVWSWIANAETQNNGGGCGAPSDGDSLFFSTGGFRTAQTVDLNLSRATLVHATIKLGSATASSTVCHSPSAASDSVVLAYSIDGGLTWTKLRTYQYDNYRVAYVHSQLLPDRAKTPATRIAWFQQYPDGDDNDLWNLDDVYIGYADDNPVTAFGDSFDPLIPNKWLFYPNFVVESSACQRSAVLLSRAAGATATTRDLKFNRPVVTAFEPTLTASPSAQDWSSVQGFRYATTCALTDAGWVFDGGPARMAETVDLDLSASGLVVQFDLGYGAGSCDGPESSDEFIIVEYSVDAGTSWVELKTHGGTSLRTHSLRLDDVPAARTSATRLRWRQGAFTDAKDVWTLSSILVRGVPNSDPVVTVDYNLGCEEQTGDAAFAIDYSTNYGASWITCTQCSPTPNGCSTWTQDGQCTFTTATTPRNTWRRASLPMPNLDSVRIRLRVLSETQVAFDNFYAGVQCPNRCGGHGYCINNGSCVCDAGFERDASGSCAPAPDALPTALMEDFSNFDPLQWTEATGIVASRSEACSGLGGGSKMVFSKGYRRALATKDLNLTHASFVEFVLQLGDAGSRTCTPPSVAAEGVALAYSTNGGLTYTKVKEFSYTSATEATLFSVPLPDAAQSDATRIMWLQASGEDNVDVWALDSIYVGPAVAAAPTSLYQKFTSGVDRSLIANTFNGLVSEYCGQRAIYFSGSEREDGVAGITTVPLDLPDNSYLQVYFTTGCTSPSSDFEISVEVSSNDGASWNDVVSTCNPVASTTCSTWSSLTGSGLLSSDWASGWHRLTIPVSSGTGLRFRLLASSRFGSETKQRQFAIGQLYIGGGCGADMCGGHGTCVAGTCDCDDGYVRSDTGSCRVQTQLSRELFESFEFALSSEKWQQRPNGGSFDTNGACGEVSSGRSFLFRGSATRRLETLDMDTRAAAFVEFSIRMGAGTTACPHVTRDAENVVVAASNNGGTIWTMIGSVDKDEASLKAVRRAIVIPSEFQTASTRFLFWQPEHSLTSDAWAIDDIFVGRTDMQPKALNSFFTEAPLSRVYFPRQVNTQLGPVCQRQALSFTASAAHQSLQIGPLDLAGATAFVQFDLSTSCTAAPTAEFDVYVTSSTAGFDSSSNSEQHLVPETCNPLLDTSCTTYYWKATERTFHSRELTNGWTRVVIPIPSPAPALRLRISTDVSTSTATRSLSVANLYVGGGCGASAYGCGPFGICINGTRCICDAGFSVSRGDDGLCHRTNPLNGFLETFEDEVLTSRWSKLTGADFRRSSCGVVSAFSSLFLGLPSRQRFVFTQELNLTTARFIEYVLYATDAGTCTSPSVGAEGLVLGYSTDGGITFTRLHRHQYDVAVRPTQYITELPAEARTPHTVLGFTQPNSDGANIDVWSLDDLYIGPTRRTLPANAEIHFERSRWDTDKFMFAPNAEVKTFCERPALVFSVDTDVGFAWFESNMLSLGEGAFVQLHISASCADDAISPRDDLKLVVETYDLGDTAWKRLPTSCSPTQDSNCDTVHTPGEGELRVTDFQQGWHRITLPLTSVKDGRRYRFRVLWSSAATFAITDVYIGNECPLGCSGFGSCKQGTCVCDEGYKSDMERGCVPETSPLQEFREPFTETPLSATRWRRISGGAVSATGGGCGVIAEGASVHFDGGYTRFMETVDINTTSARLLEFTVSTGSNSGFRCRYISSDREGFVVAYSTDAGFTWHVLDHGRSSSPSRRTVPLPSSARTPYTRFLWWQPFFTTTNYDTWNVDDVYVGPPGTTAPTAIAEDFNSGPLSSFVLLRGAGAKSYCNSDGRALVFEGDDVTEYRLTTRDINLKPDELVVANDALTTTPSQLWDTVKGRRQAQACGLGSSGWVFDGQDLDRVATTVPLDVTSTNLKLSFAFAFGAGGCDPPEDSSRNENVFLEYSIDDGQEWKQLLELTYSAGASVRTVTVALDDAAPDRTAATRFRWVQKTFTEGADVWAIADVAVRGVPLQRHYLQFDLAAGCMRDGAADPVSLYYSTGLTGGFKPLSDLTCESVDASCSTWQHPGVIYGNEARGGWQRFTFVLGNNPGPNVRVALEREPGSLNTFAIDNLFVGGLCPRMCSGHGRCTIAGECVCDDGYEGAACATPKQRLQQGLQVDFSASSISLGMHFASWTGSIKRCGSNSVGLVFDQDGRHEVTTKELNLVGVSEIEFGIARCTFRSMVVSVSASTDGGITWVVLGRFPVGSAVSTQTAVVDGQSGMRLRWWSTSTESARSWFITEIRARGACQRTPNACTGANEVCVNTAEGFACECADDYFRTDNGTCAQDMCMDVTCTVPNECQIPGTCDRLTGHCSSPDLLTGPSCDDGNSATFNDTCVDGMCKGSSLCDDVVCETTIPCRGSGVCDAETGICSYSTLDDGTKCNDGDFTTFNDRCVDGQCVGQENRCIGVDCSDPLPQCYDKWTCNPVNGECELSGAQTGTSCNDGDPTTTDTCDTGECVGTPKCAGVTCDTPTNECMEAQCVATTGQCEEVPVADDTECNDGNNNTIADMCMSGMCIGEDLCEDVSCETPPSPCHDAGTCAGGQCRYPVLSDGTPCDDDDETTVEDACRDGVCVGAPNMCLDNPCQQPEECRVFETCDPLSGVCSYSDATNGTLCSVGECFAGVCVEIEPECDLDACSSTGPCIVNRCEGDTCISEHKMDNTTCTITGTSSDGVCVAGACTDLCEGVTCAPKTCFSEPKCLNGTGVCMYEKLLKGTACDDGDASTIDDKCMDGTCVGVPDPCFDVDCSQGATQCQVLPGTCSGGRCIFSNKQDGTACDDGLDSTENDVCTSGVCAGTDKCANVQCAMSQCADAYCVGGVCFDDPAARENDPCDDGDIDTVNDVCVDGVCAGNPAGPCRGKGNFASCSVGGETGFCFSGGCVISDATTTTTTTTTSTTTTTTATTTSTAATASTPASTAGPTDKPGSSASGSESSALLPAVIGACAGAVVIIVIVAVVVVIQVRKTRVHRLDNLADVSSDESATAPPPPQSARQRSLYLNPTYDGPDSHKYEEPVMMRKGGDESVYDTPRSPVYADLGTNPDDEAEA